MKRSDSEMDDEELQAKLKEAFDKMDVDKSGSISRDELKIIFENSGYKATDKAIQSILKAVDSDKSGYINFEDFSTYYIRLRSKIQLIMDIQEQFRDADKDNSGYITREELKEAMAQTSDLEPSEQEVDEFIYDADTNKDGKISLQEWLDSFVGIYD